MASFFNDPALLKATSQLAELAVSAGEFKAVLLSGPLEASAAACAGFAMFCYVGAATSGYWSYVDRLWSIVPAVYAGLFAYYFPANQRLVLMATLSVGWAVRLSYNFARKGGYGSEEDYRWPIVRAWFEKHDPLHPLGREAFQLLFVAAYQHALLWLLAAPAASRVLFFAAQTPDAACSLGPWDWTLAAAFVVLLGLETLTDEHQWAFQRAKHALSPRQRELAGGDLARGFATGGPFRYSRHLNFCCEQSLWWVFYGFGVVASTETRGGPRAAAAAALGAGEGFAGLASVLVNPTALGPLLLSLLFLGSTDMTERLALAKYPAYAAYQRTTSRLLPWFPGPPLDSPRGQKLVAAACGQADVTNKAK